MKLESSTAPTPASRRAIWLGAAIIVLAGVAAYHNSLGGPFVFDDPSSITANPTIRRLWPLWEPLTPPRAAITVQGRPLLNFSLALNYAVGGDAVRGYHVLNLAIHLGSALVLFGLVRRTLQRPIVQTTRPRFAGSATGLALTVALLWAVHPLQTQAVTYVIQRAESLMGLFYLLTLYLFVRGAESSMPTRWFGLAVATCFLGMATKEVMVTAPVIVLLYDRAFVAGSLGTAWRTRRGFYLALASSWLLLGYLVAGTGGNRGGSAGFDVGIAWWDYALTQFVAIAHYLRLAVWPAPLVFEYGTFWVNSVGNILPSMLVVTSLAFFTLIATWRKPAIGFLGCFFFAILSVTSFVPGTTQMIVEHRMYLPLAAVLVGVILVFEAWLRRPAALAGATTAIALGLLTHERNAVYRSERTLWDDTVTKRPANALAREMHAQALERVGEIAAAMAERERALEIFPGFAVAHCNLGDSLGRLGKFDEAIRHYEAALGSKPAYADAHNGLGCALCEVGRLPEAITHLSRAIELLPEFAEAHLNLANALSTLGRTAEAVTHYERARRLSPSIAAVHNNLGNALAQLGRTDEALRAFEQALQLSPENANFHYNFGNLLARLNRKAEARDHFAAAVRSAPGFIEARAILDTLLRELGETPVARGAP